MAEVLASPVSVPRDDRRHDLDALRAFAMLLGIALHASLSFFQAPWPVQDQYPTNALGLFFLVIHGFRMPLFFILSGYFTMMLFRKRGLAALVKQRATRILLPLGLSVLTVLPLTAWVSYRAMTARATDAPRGDTSLAQAIRMSDANAIDQRLADDEQLNRLDEQFGVSPLGWAVLQRDLALAERLIARGADVNVRNRDGNRPLHAAAFFGGDSLAAILLEHGADPHAQSDAGDKPLAATQVDWGATQYMVAILGLKQPERAELEAERAKVRARLAAIVGETVDAPSATTASTTPDLATRWRQMRDSYQGWLRSDRWRVSIGSFSWQIFEADTFAHLWFLWFLCWMVGGFALLARPLEMLIARVPAAWLARAMIPAVLLPQAVMGTGPVSFGPDTSSGIVPQPHLLLYYGLFFGFGVLSYAAESQGRPLGRWAWTPFCLALLVAFPLWLVSIANVPVAAVAQVLFVWCMSLGLIGLFRRYLPSESPWIRYVSDSSYWLYLAHLPLVMGLQSLVRNWPLDGWLKFLALNVVSIVLLLASYQLLVRNTWIGVLLNGRRRRDVAPRAAV